MLNYLLIIPAILLLLVLIALIKTLLSPRKKSEFRAKSDPAREKEYAEKLSTMVRCDTTSRRGNTDIGPFLEFHKVLEELFPLVHEKLEKTVIDGNLLYYWKGKSSERPAVLMGHQDVVPAEGKWTHAPFSGDIEDGKVWGRGSADTKSSVMTWFEACEELLAESYVPDQDLYLASSCTEEIGGDGGPKIVAELKKRGIKPYFVCDEGGAIVENPMAGVNGSYAMVGVLEKGIGDIVFTARSSGGHASYPPKNSPIARLSAFVTATEKHYPLKADFEPQLTAMFDRIAPYGPFYMRFLLGNLWLFKPLCKLLLPKLSPQLAALTR
ncbi:MAG: M20/M25/M40 family metallo-hydrolase, partial [Oscillospiraceae bacterium]|nr:M20/M25/M40 family metallo-hydrolase [Oscillospiraceae bacterium]